MLKLTIFLSVLYSFSIQVQAEDEVPSPSCSSSEYLQFSFWLGKWTAFSESGQKLGTNELVKVMGGCAMQENWQGAGGKYRGTSYNFYDAVEKTWHQTWVDNAGGHLILSGGLIGDEMQLSGERKQPNGKVVRDRITWTPLEDGRVRQHWQTTADNGESWGEVFDGYYTKD